MKVGHGIVTWSSAERRSNRYGSIHLTDSPFEQGPAAVATLDLSALHQLDGKRVRVTCMVVESRKSGHTGDLFLHIEPTRPDVGESIEVGVGTLRLTTGWGGKPDLCLEPGDGREALWIDPRVLYRLHDQTVDVFIEETDAPFSLAPVLDCEPDGMIDTGDGGYFQVKREPGPVRLMPVVEALGDGLFIVKSQLRARGRRLQYETPAGRKR